MTIEIADIVNDYTADKSHTLKTLATKYGIKSADVAAALRLSGVAVRRGPPGGIREEARAAARATLARKSLHKTLTKLAYKHGVETVRETLKEIVDGNGPVF